METSILDKGFKTIVKKKKKKEKKEKEKMAPNPAAVIIILVLIIVGIVLYFKFNSSSSSSALSSMTTAATMQTINYNSMSSSGNSNNCTYSIWFYISDWDTNINNNKILFVQSTGPNANGYVNPVQAGDISQTLNQLAPSSSSSSSSSNIANVGPMVYFTAMENDMQIYMPCSTTYSATTEGDYVVTNIPLQRWVNLLLSVYGRTLDIYLDGKLVQTQILPGPLNVPSNSNVYITPCTGFGGWTSKFQYIPNATNPQGAWNIYQQGYGQSFFSSVGGQNHMTVTFTQNGNTTATYTM